MLNFREENFREKPLICEIRDIFSPMKIFRYMVFRDQMANQSLLTMNRGYYLSIKAADVQLRCSKSQI